MATQGGKSGRRAIAGELTTGRIMIEDGANFKRAIEIERSSAKVTDSGTLLAHAEKDSN